VARELKVAVVGVTGMVGQEMVRVLEQRRFPVGELVAVASPRSAGRTVRHGGQDHPVVPLRPEVFEGVDLALFSAGGSVSSAWCPVAAEHGALVVDNSSAWRMDADVPLVVPEVNLDAARDRPRGIIANPNCSTIQMVVALKPLHDEARLRRVIVSTYQAISGAGARAVESFQAQQRALAQGRPVENGTLPGQLAGSLLMHWKADVATGYQEEELKMIHETRKILGEPDLRVSVTTVRVPVVTGHSESITVETERPLGAARARELLSRAPGVVVMDDLANGIYPTPLVAAGRDETFVGRIRDDLGNPGGIQMWVVSDNLRKGAATNAVQIAEAVLL